MIYIAMLISGNAALSIPRRMRTEDAMRGVKSKVPNS